MVLGWNLEKVVVDGGSLILMLPLSSFAQNKKRTDFMVDSFVSFERLLGRCRPRSFLLAGKSSSKNNKNSSSSFFINIELYVLKRALSGGCK